MKKILFVVILITVILFPVRAAPEVDTGKLDGALDKVEHYSFFGSCEDIFKAITENRFSLDGKSVSENIVLLLFGGIKSGISQLTVLLGACIVLSIAENLKFLSPETESIALMGGRIIFACALLSAVVQFAQGTKDALNGMSSFTGVLMPILLPLLAFCGAQGSVSILSPSAAMLSSFLLNGLADIVMPLIISGCTLAFVDGILGNGKLTGIASFFKSCASFLLGGVFTVFSAIIALQGVTAGAVDGISIRGIKYALSSSVPIIGGSMSESLSMVLASGTLIKSAAGIAGIISIAGIIAVPIINICAYILLLKALDACISPFAGKTLTVQIYNACEFLKLTVILLFGAGILWFVYLGLIICAGSSLL